MKFSFSSITPFLICLLLIIVSCEEQNPEVIDHIFFDGSIKLEDSTYYHVTSPSGDDVWSEGSTHYITWDRSGRAGVDVDLYYSINADTNWIGIGQCYSCEGYEWSIPNLTTSSNTSLIKVADRANYERYAISSYFSLVADSTFYRITSPSGGESWEELSTQSIEWVSSGDVAGSYEYLQLFYI